MRFRDSKWSIVARGVRNSVGFDFNPQNNRLYFTDNGRDWLGDSLPSCELNVLLDDGDFLVFHICMQTTLLILNSGKVTMDMKSLNLF